MWAKIDTERFWVIVVMCLTTVTALRFKFRCHALIQKVQIASASKRFGQDESKFQPEYNFRATPDPDTRAALSTFVSPGAELNTLLESMPTAEKYNLLIQSYAGSVLDEGARNSSLMQKIESLFMEMIEQSIEPTMKSSELMLTASASFRNNEQFGRSLQFIKAGQLSSKGLCTL